MKNKKLNLIPLFVAFLLIAVVVYFLKPNKFVTYIRAKFGIQNTVLVYSLDKNSAEFLSQKKLLRKFLMERGISGTAYEDKSKEYYVTIVPKSVNPSTEIAFGFKDISPEDFYKMVYSTKQHYFTRTLKIIE